MTTKNKGSKLDNDTTLDEYEAVVIAVTEVFTGSIRLVPTRITSIAIIKPIKIFIVI